jgi:hypothetical protein
VREGLEHGVQHRQESAGPSEVLVTNVLVLHNADHYGPHASNISLDTMRPEGVGLRSGRRGLPRVRLTSHV